MFSLYGNGINAEDEIKGNVFLFVFFVWLVPINNFVDLNIKLLINIIQ